MKSCLLGGGPQTKTQKQDTTAEADAEGADADAGAATPFSLLSQTKDNMDVTTAEAAAEAQAPPPLSLSRSSRSLSRSLSSYGGDAASAAGDGRDERHVFWWCHIAREEQQALEALRALLLQRRWRALQGAGKDGDGDGDGDGKDAGGDGDEGDAAALAALPPSLSTDLALLRFLRARSFDPWRALAMYVDMARWRVRHLIPGRVGAGGICASNDASDGGGGGSSGGNGGSGSGVNGGGARAVAAPAEADEAATHAALKRLYPHYLHKTDLHGRPVSYRRLGAADADALLREVGAEAFLRHHMRANEAFRERVLPACSRAAGREIVAGVVVLDMQGFSLARSFTPAVRAFLPILTAYDQAFYPEHLGAMLIVNCPALFRSAWMFVRPFLDERTLRKVTVAGGGGAAREALASLIPAEHLPEAYGGTSVCDGVTDVGPWDDDEEEKEEEGDEEGGKQRGGGAEAAGAAEAAAGEEEGEEEDEGRGGGESVDGGDVGPAKDDFGDVGPAHDDFGDVGPANDDCCRGHGGGSAAGGGGKGAVPMPRLGTATRTSPARKRDAIGALFSGGSGRFSSGGGATRSSSMGGGVARLLALAGSSGGGGCTTAGAEGEEVAEAAAAAGVPAAAVPVAAVECSRSPRHHLTVTVGRRRDSGDASSKTIVSPAFCSPRESWGGLEDDDGGDGGEEASWSETVAEEEEEEEADDAPAASSLRPASWPRVIVLGVCAVASSLRARRAALVAAARGGGPSRGGVGAARAS